MRSKSDSLLKLECCAKRLKSKLGKRFHFKECKIITRPFCKINPIGTYFLINHDFSCQNLIKIVIRIIISFSRTHLIKSAAQLE